MLSRTWTLTVSATGKATTKLFGDKQEAALNLMNPSHAQPQTGYETETENQTPWFLSVGLVNPHDVMWFPMDQPWYQDRERLHTGSKH